MSGGVFSGAKLNGMTIRESAADGSDFTNPDADYRRLFLGEDGLLHLKDAAGAVTDVGSGGMTQSTLGTTSIGASFKTARGVYLKKVTLASAGLVANIVAGVKGDGTNVSGLAAAIYTDSAGAPVNVIAVGGASGLLSDSSAYTTNLKLNTTARLVRMAIGAWLTAADYWLAVRLFGGADSQIQLAYSSGTGSDSINASASTNWIDVSLDGVTTGTDDHTIYADILR